MVSKTGKLTGKLTGQLPEIAYPPAPWQLGGDSWVGIFKSRIPVRAPVPLKPVLNDRYLVIALIRYLHGTLTYDELIIGSMARYGWRVGLYVHYIWVDDMCSLWGGRRIWGLNKEMAEFSWQGSTVEITDDQGLIANITVNQERSTFPAIWLPVPSFGQLDDKWLFTCGSIKTNLASAGMQINQWSNRFPYQISGLPVYSIAGKPFDMTFVKPKNL